jgi:uncharacterized protein (TIGR03067 family)
VAVCPTEKFPIPVELASFQLNDALEQRLPVATFLRSPKPSPLAADQIQSEVGVKVGSSIVLTAALLAATSALAGQEAKKENEQLQGNWSFVHAEHDGHKSSPDKLKALKLTIGADKLTLRGDKGMEYVYKTDPSKKPKTIDVTPSDGPDKGMVLQGIYELKGDELKLCLSKPGRDRPTEFVSKENTGLVLIVLKREKQ